MFQENPIRHIRFRAVAIAALLSALGLSVSAKEHVPLLKAGLTSQSYEVSQISQPFMAEITFHRQGRFFIVGRANNSGLMKFDATGQQVFQLDYANDNYRPAFSPYIITKRGILDFSQPRPRPQKIAVAYLAPKNKRLTKRGFLQRFSPLYDAADVVVYGDYDGDLGKQAIYLQTAGKWAVFYVSAWITDLEIDRDYDLGASIAQFAPKFERMVLLRDVARKTYSYSDYRLRDGKIRLPEDKLRYSRANSLKRLSYSSDFVFEEIPYTPIPGSFAGIATYRLTIAGEAIEFKEIAIRGALRLRADSNLSLFQLPKPYDKEVPVTFLEFRPISNADTLGSEGLYIIRPKR